MRTGGMDTQVEILRASGDLTEGGYPIDDAFDVQGTVWANLVYLRGNEMFVAGKVKDQAEVQFIVYKDDAQNLETSDMLRITREGVTEIFNILDIVPECRPRLGKRIIARKAVKK